MFQQPNKTKARYRKPKIPYGYLKSINYFCAFINGEKMGKILCIDTATDICSVAVSENGNVWVYRDSEDDRSHSVNLAVYVDDLLQKSDLKVSDLDAIAISKGPGSYGMA